MRLAKERAVELVILGQGRMKFWRGVQLFIAARSFIIMTKDSSMAGILILSWTSEVQVIADAMISSEYAQVSQ